MNELGVQEAIPLQKYIEVLSGSVKLLMTIISHCHDVEIQKYQSQDFNALFVVTINVIPESAELINFA